MKISIIDGWMGSSGHDVAQELFGLSFQEYFCEIDNQ